MDVTAIAIAAISLLVGLLAGSLLTRKLSPGEKKRRELENQVRQKEDELKIYQRDVSEHFVKTSELIREMTRSQQEISEQLATSAMRLTSPEVSRQVQESAFAGLGRENQPRILSSAPAEPPKDYAPSVPGGVLSEHYGLSELAEHDEPGSRRGLNEDGDETDTPARRAPEDDPTLKIS